MTARRIAGLFVFAVGCSLNAPALAQPGWSPTKTVEFVVGSAPGGGNDRTARVLQKIWRELGALENVAVVNKVGGGGSVAYAYTSQHRGDPHFIAVARIALLTGHILGRSAVTYSDMTPLAVIGNEPMALAVRADSTIRTIGDLVERWRTDPQSVSISLGSTRGGNTHFFVASVAKAAGVDPRKLKTLTFGGGADSVTQVLGGHIDMMSASIDNAAPHHKAGRLRIIGVATAKRVAALPEVPTAREQGYAVTLDGWVAIMAPQGLNAAQVAYWEELFERSTNQPEWRHFLGASVTEPEFRNAQQTRQYLEAQYAMARGLLSELGMLR